jgi:DNA-binding transcriptional LysR family regulator
VNFTRLRALEALGRTGSVTRAAQATISMELASHDAIIGAVEEGLGVGVVPASLVSPPAGAGRSRLGIHVLAVRDARLRHDVSVVYHRERRSFPLTRRVVDAVRGARRPPPRAARRGGRPAWRG